MVVLGGVMLFLLHGLNTDRISKCQLLFWKEISCQVKPDDRLYYGRGGGGGDGARAGFGFSIGIKLCQAQKHACFTHQHLAEDYTAKVQLTTTTRSGLNVIETFLYEQKKVPCHSTFCQYAKIYILFYYRVRTHWPPEHSDHSLLPNFGVTSFFRGFLTLTSFKKMCTGV